MDAFAEIYEALIVFLSTPRVRAFATALSLVSLCVSLWALRKTIHAVRVQSNDVMAEHARYLEDRWQELHALTLTNAEFAECTAEIFGTDVRTAKKDAALLMFVNVASVNFSQWKNRVVSKANYEAHMISIFSHFKGDRGQLLRLIDLVGYDPEFREACKTYLDSPADASPPKPAV